jgi:hypothetical protein
MNTELVQSEEEIQQIWRNYLLASWQRYQKCARTTWRKVRQLHASPAPEPDAIRAVRRCLREEDVAREDYLLALKSLSDHCHDRGK